ncbi:MAG: DnaJ domain-containing protein [Cyanobacteria bacterium J06633_2]
MDDILSYYELLELQPGATLEEVKQAYRKQAMRWHPDRFPDDPHKQEEAEERIKVLNIAYAYFREHGTEQAHARASSSSPSSKTSTSSKVTYQTNHTSAETYFQEGSDLAKAGRYQDAADALSIAIRLRSDYVEAYHLRSLMFSSLGFSHRANSDRDRARQIELEQALRIRREQSTQSARSTQTHTKQTNTPNQSSSTSVASWRCTQTFSGHTEAVTDVAFAQNGKVLVSSGLDGAIYVWNISKGRQLSRLVRQGHAVHGLAVSSDGQLIASGCADGTVKLWHIRTGSLVHVFTGHTAPVLTVAFSPNRKVIVSGSADGSIRFWHVQHRGLLYILNDHRASVRAIAVNPNGLTLASSDGTHRIITWDMQTGLCTRPSLSTINDALALEFSPNRRDLWVGRIDGTVQRLDAETGESLCQFDGHQEAVHSVALNGTGQLIASGSGDRTVRLWSPSNAQGLLSGHDGSVNTIAFSPDGTLLVSGSSDRTIKLWTPASS